MSRGGVRDGVGDRHVIAEPRQVADDKRSRTRARDSAHVMLHVGDRHLERVVVPEHHVGDGVADEDHIDTRGVDDPSRSARRTR